MTERLKQIGQCWPTENENQSGITNLTKNGPQTIFNCTQLTSMNACLLANAPCDLLPTFINHDNVLSCTSEAGRIILNPATRKVVTPYREALLSPSEITLLTTLMQHPGEISSTVDLYRTINPNSMYIPHRVDNMIRVYMSRLRTKLGDTVKQRRTNDKLPIIGSTSSTSLEPGGYFMTTPSPKRR